MNDLIAKISSYDIFNNLVPGAIFSFLLDWLGVASLNTPSIITDFVLFYFLGLIVSRIGSVIVGPLLQLLRIIPKGDYRAFIEASQNDNKILTLLESRNLYRTLVALLLVTLLAYHMKGMAPAWMSESWRTTFLLAVLAVLFIFAYRKQNSFITRRVEHHKGGS